MQSCSLHHKILRRPQAFVWQSLIGEFGQEEILAAKAVFLSRREFFFFHNSAIQSDQMFYRRGAWQTKPKSASASHHNYYNIIEIGPKFKFDTHTHTHTHKLQWLQCDAFDFVPKGLQVWNNNWLCIA